MVKHLSIRTQILLSFLAVIMVTVISSSLALITMSESESTARGLYNIVIQPLDYVSKSRSLMEEVKTEGRATFLLDDAEARLAVIDQIEDDVTQAKAYMEAFNLTIIKDEARKPSQDLIAALNNYLALLPKFRELVSKDITITGIRAELVDYIDNVLSPASSACLGYMTQLNTIRISLGEERVDELANKVQDSVIQTILISVVAVIIMLTLGVFISFYLSKPILTGVTIMSKAASGDFTVSLPNNYGAEIGKLYAACNALLTFNRNSISLISNSSVSLRESSSELLETSTKMAENSSKLNEQTAAVNSTVEEFSTGMIQSSNSLTTATEHISAVAAAIEEVNATISEVAMAAEETSTRVVQSSALVDNIKNSISMASGSATLVSNAFNNVAENVDEINKSIISINDHCASAVQKVLEADGKAKNADGIIRQLETTSKQINKVIGIINDIADQTNMLALNASIEAAGAGEAGKGFMVVANEVKELARQTADATDDVADQIENMQKNMPVAVNAVTEIAAIINGLNDFMISLVQEVALQRKRSDQISEESASSAKRMNEISLELNRISDNAHSVTKTVVESTKGVNEIAKSTAELEVGTREIAMNAERVYTNIHVIDNTTREMANSLTGISQNIQLIHTEAGSVQKNAGNTNRASEEMFAMANDMETLVASFKIK